MQGNIGTSYLQQNNYISEIEDTHFYMTLTTKPMKYGVCINIKDVAEAEKIIGEFMEQEKPRLEAWRKDLLQEKYIKQITDNNKEKWQEYVDLIMKGGNKTQWIKDNI